MIEISQKELNEKTFKEFSNSLIVKSSTKKSTLQEKENMGNSSSIKISPHLSPIKSNRQKQNLLNLPKLQNISKTLNQSNPETSQKKKMRTFQKSNKINPTAPKVEKCKIMKMIEKALQYHENETLEETPKEELPYQFFSDLYKELSFLIHSKKLSKQVEQKILVRLLNLFLSSQIKKADYLDLFQGKTCKPSLHLSKKKKQAKEGKEEEEEKEKEKEEEEKKESKATVEQIITKISNSFESIKIVLCVMSCKELSRQIFNEDLIEDITRIFHFQITHTIFPYYDSTLRNNKQNEKQILAPKMEKKLKDLFNQSYEILHLLHSLLQITKIPSDSTIYKLSNLSLSIFFVQGVQSLHPKSLILLQQIFSRYSSHRDYILSDLLSSLSKLSSSKKLSAKAYKLESGEKIQFTSLLILQLFQSSVFPFSYKSNHSSSIDLDPSALSLSSSSNSQREKQEEEQEEGEDSLFSEAIINARNFISSFLEKCSEKGKATEHKKLLENFVEDCLSTMNKPQFPASQFVLHLLTKHLIEQLLSPSNNSKQSNELMRSFAIELIGKIGASLKIEENLVSNSLLFLSSSSPSSNHSRDLCPCSQSLPNPSPLLSCVRCGRSFHSSCLEIEEPLSNKNSHSAFICDFCCIKDQIENSQTLSPLKEENESQPTLEEKKDKKNKHPKQIDLNHPSSPSSSSSSSYEEIEEPLLLQIFQRYLLHYLSISSSSSNEEKDFSSLHSSYFYLSQWKAENQIDSHQFQQLKLFIHQPFLQRFSLAFYNLLFIITNYSTFIYSFHFYYLITYLITFYYLITYYLITYLITFYYY